MSIHVDTLLIYIMYTSVSEIGCRYKYCDTMRSIDCKHPLNTDILLIPPDIHSLRQTVMLLEDAFRDGSEIKTLEISIEFVVK